MFPVLTTHCGEFVCRDFLLALCDGVEEQVLQAGQDAGLPSPAGNTKREKHTDRKVRKESRQLGGNMEGKLQQREEKKKLFEPQGEAVSNNQTLHGNTRRHADLIQFTTSGNDSLCAGVSSG